MNNSEMHGEEFVEYMESDYYDSQQKNRFDFVSKLFSSKKSHKGLVAFRKPKNVGPARFQRVKHLTPHQGENILVLTEGNDEYEDGAELVQCGDIGRPQYNVMFVESGSIKTYPDTYQREKKGLPTVKEYVQESEGKTLSDIQKTRGYVEVVTVEDRGTDPWEQPLKITTEDKGTDPWEVLPAKTIEMVDTGTDPREEPPVQTIKTEDKATDAPYPLECKKSCAKRKEQLSRDLQEREKSIKSSLQEGIKLLEDVEKIKNHLAQTDKVPDAIIKNLNHKQETPTDFIHLSRTCLVELAKLLVTSQKQYESELQKIKNEIVTVKKEKNEKDGKIRSLERKLEAQTVRMNQETIDIQKQQAKIEKLQEAIEKGRKLIRDTEKGFKEKTEKLEAELACLKEKNSELSHCVEEKTRLTLHLETSVERLQNSLDHTKQQLKEVHSSYKTKFAKFESEHTTKMATLCENQASTNKQLSQALSHSNNYVNQLQETKKENTSLLADNKSLREKFVMMEQEMIKSQERCSTAERKLSREIQEVLSLKSQVERLEKLSEEELLSVDGDIWCQIMYQQDQWILDDLRASLNEKESNLENLRSQGNCALKDFEKAQNELQQRRQQFNELKDVFLDFEKKRDSVVREQREFYNKMMLLSRKTFPKDKFFKNLIEESQLKSSRIEELELQLSTNNKVIDETNKISEAQLKALQTEMKFTAEKLYEFENQIQIKDLQLQDVIRVFEQEKKNKTIAEEAMSTYKILLEDSKKENTELRNKLHFLEDLEKNRANVLKTAEELATETQKRQDTEYQLKSLEKELLELKRFLHSSETKFLIQAENLPNNTKEVEKLKKTIRALTEDKKYLERILAESQKSKELLQKDQEDLCKKMGHAVRVMVEARATQETLEMNLDKRMHIIKELQKSQIETEDRLDILKDVIRDMRDTIDDLKQKKIDLEHKLSNHMHCKAERAMHQELQLLQRDKAVTEQQNSREKEMLLQRIRDNEETMKEQHKHLRAFQEQLDSLNAQLRDTKAQLASERHVQTQQLLSVQAERKKQDMYIQEIEGRLTYESMLRTNNPGSITTAPIFSSDSYEYPDRDYTKHHHNRK